MGDASSTRRMVSSPRNTILPSLRTVKQLEPSSRIESIHVYNKRCFCLSFFMSYVSIYFRAPSVAHSASSTLPYYFESHVYRLVVYGHHPVAAAVQCHCVATAHAEEVLGHRPSEERPGGTVRDVPLEVMAREGKGQRAWELVYVVSLQILVYSTM